MLVAEMAKYWLVAFLVMLMESVCSSTVDDGVTVRAHFMPAGRLEMCLVLFPIAEPQVTCPTIIKSSSPSRVVIAFISCRMPMELSRVVPPCRLSSVRLIVFLLFRFEKFTQFETHLCCFRSLKITLEPRIVNECECIVNGYRMDDEGISNEYG